MLYGWTVEIGVGGILDIGGEGASAVHKPPVFGAVGGEAEDHAAGAHGLCQFTDDIALGAHLYGSPAGG